MDRSHRLPSSLCRLRLSSTEVWAPGKLTSTADPPEPLLLPTSMGTDCICRRKTVRILESETIKFQTLCWSFYASINDFIFTSPDLSWGRTTRLNSDTLFFLPCATLFFPLCLHLNLIRRDPVIIQNAGYTLQRSPLHHRDTHSPFRLILRNQLTKQACFWTSEEVRAPRENPCMH